MCLNQDAILIWNLCNGGNMLKTIIDKLTEDFPEESKKEVEGKIIKVVNTLLNFNLIAIVG